MTSTLPSPTADASPKPRGSRPQPPREAQQTSPSTSAAQARPPPSPSETKGSTSTGVSSNYADIMKGWQEQCGRRLGMVESLADRARVEIAEEEYQARADARERYTVATMHQRRRDAQVKIQKIWKGSVPRTLLAKSLAHRHGMLHDAAAAEEADEREELGALFTSEARLFPKAAAAGKILRWYRHATARERRERIVAAGVERRRRKAAVRIQRAWRGWRTRVDVFRDFHPFELYKRRLEAAEVKARAAAAGREREARQARLWDDLVGGPEDVCGNKLSVVANRMRRDVYFEFQMREAHERFSLRGLRSPVPVELVVEDEADGRDAVEGGWAAYVARLDHAVASADTVVAVLEAYDGASVADLLRPASRDCGGAEEGGGDDEDDASSAASSPEPSPTAAAAADAHGGVETSPSRLRRAGEAVVRRQRGVARLFPSAAELRDRHRCARRRLHSSCDAERAREAAEEAVGRAALVDVFAAAPEMHGHRVAAAERTEREGRAEVAAAEAAAVLGCLLRWVAGEEEEARRVECERGEGAALREVGRVWVAEAAAEIARCESEGGAAVADEEDAVFQGLLRARALQGDEVGGRCGVRAEEAEGWAGCGGAVAVGMEAAVRGEAARVEAAAFATLASDEAEGRVVALLRVEMNGGGGSFSEGARSPGECRRYLRALQLVEPHDRGVAAAEEGAGRAGVEALRRADHARTRKREEALHARLLRAHLRDFHERQRRGVEAEERRGRDALDSTQLHAHKTSVAPHYKPHTRLVQETEHARQRERLCAWEEDMRGRFLVLEDALYDAGLRMFRTEAEAEPSERRRVRAGEAVHRASVEQDARRSEAEAEEEMAFQELEWGLVIAVAGHTLVRTVQRFLTNKRVGALRRACRRCETAEAAAEDADFAVERLPTEEECERLAFESEETACRQMLGEKRAGAEAARASRVPASGAGCAAAAVATAAAAMAEVAERRERAAEAAAVAAAPSEPFVFKQYMLGFRSCKQDEAAGRGALTSQQKAKRGRIVADFHTHFPLQPGDLEQQVAEMCGRSEMKQRLRTDAHEHEERAELLVRWKMSYMAVCWRATTDEVHASRPLPIREATPPTGAARRPWKGDHAFDNEVKVGRLCRKPSSGSRRVASRYVSVRGLSSAPIVFATCATHTHTHSHSPLIMCSAAERLDAIERYGAREPGPLPQSYGKLPYLRVKLNPNNPKNRNRKLVSTGSDWVPRRSRDVLPPLA